MPSVVDLCNAAISHCGTRSKISDINEGSPEANACLTHFGMARDTTLRSFDWNFARVTAQLAALQSPPARWAYMYAVPVDSLRIRRLNDVPLAVLPETFYESASTSDGAGGYIPVLLTNMSPVSAIYTAQVIDPNRWDAGFADAMAYALALRVCFELTGKEDRVRALEGLWQAAIGAASADAANENSSLNRIVLPDSLIARGYDDGTQEIGQPWPR